MFSKIEEFLLKTDTNGLSKQRSQSLQPLIEYLLTKKSKEEEVQLHFICTHNSRRSQFAQVWAQVIAHFYKINLKATSGGTAVTACNERTIASLKRFGFIIETHGEINPKYRVFFSDKAEPILLYSKKVEDKMNPSTDFAAIMTCSDADSNCPVVSGCEKRFSLTYEDPKEFDDSPREEEMYDLRSREIATELLFVFKNVAKI